MALFRRRRAREDTPAASGADAGPRIEPLNDAERQWVADQVNALAAAGVDVDDAAQLGAHYDALLSAWESAPDREQQDPNPMINLIGLGMGEHLVRRAGLYWVLADYDDGAQIAVHGQPGSVLIHPTNAVAKRWVTGEHGFLPEFIEWQLRTVDELRRQEGDQPG